MRCILLSLLFELWILFQLCTRLWRYLWETTTYRRLYTQMYHVCLVDQHLYHTLPFVIPIVCFWQALSSRPLPSVSRCCECTMSLWESSVSWEIQWTYSSLCCWCYGGWLFLTVLTDRSRVRCSQASQVISCGRTCGKRQNCGRHFCSQSCHAGGLFEFNVCRTYGRWMHRVATRSACVVQSGLGSVQCVQLPHPWDPWVPRLYHQGLLHSHPNYCSRVLNETWNEKAGVVLNSVPKGI